MHHFWVRENYIGNGRQRKNKKGKENHKNKVLERLENYVCFLNGKTLYLMSDEYFVALSSTHR